ncbi:MAG: P-type conjugative transfer protein TrbJ [Methylobacter sp.]
MNRHSGRKNRIFAPAKITIMALALTSPVQAGTVMGNGGATEVTQILNNAQLMAIFQNGTSQLAQLSSMLDNEITQTAQQISMVQNQLQDLQSMGNTIMAPYNQVSGALGKLQGLVSRGQSLSYTLQNMDQQFGRMYPGFGNYGSGGSYATQYQGWSQTSMDGIKGALEAQGLQASDFATEQSTMDQLNSMSSSANGTVSAVQAGNAIAAQQVVQLQKLRQLQMEQFNAYASYTAGQQAKQDAEKEALMKFMNQGNGTIRKPGESGFKKFDFRHL